jgi:hypothetical protein
LVDKSFAGQSNIDVAQRLSMRINRFVLRGVALLGCLAAGSVCSAQSMDPLPAEPIPVQVVGLVVEPSTLILSQEHLQELDQWVTDFVAWQKWADRWLNRRQPGLWSYRIERNEKPDPPVWLSDVCGLLGGDTEFVRPCELLAVWRDDVVVGKTRHVAATGSIQHETQPKTAWWQHLHVDGLWSATQSNLTPFGLFGTHYTINVEGRLQIFAAPGLLLVSVPSLHGNRELLPATDWGISYRLFNVRQHTVHFNLVHAWLLSQRADLINPNLTMVGLSLTLGRRSH